MMDKITITKLITETFPKNVMRVICADHHKNKDGSFVIEYNYFSEEWSISHYGYVREEISAHGKDFQEVAKEYLGKIRRANQQVLENRGGTSGGVGKKK